MSMEVQAIPELISKALHQVGTLVQNELRLARAEMSAKAVQAVVGIGLVAGGALVSIAAFVLTLMALAAWFVHLGLSPGFANLAAGIVGFCVSGGLVWVGMNRLTPENLMPDKTLHQFEQDAAAVREQTR